MKQAEIKQLGGTVDNTVTALKELNATIKELKAIKKAEEKAAKDAAKAEEKAKKAEEKAAKKAAKAASKSPSFPRMNGEPLCSPTRNSARLPSGLERMVLVCGLQSTRKTALSNEGS